jgi:hypothetical protein
MDLLYQSWPDYSAMPFVVALMFDPVLDQLPMAKLAKLAILVQEVAPMGRPATMELGPPVLVILLATQLELMELPMEHLRHLLGVPMELAQEQHLIHYRQEPLCQDYLISATEYGNYCRL